MGEETGKGGGGKGEPGISLNNRTVGREQRQDKTKKVDAWHNNEKNLYDK